MPEYRVIWTRRAKRDLTRISEYIAKENRGAAMRLLQTFFDRANLLAITPRIGSRVDAEEFQEVRQLVVGRYRLLYQIDESPAQIAVLTVWHSARREPPLP